MRHRARHGPNPLFMLAFVLVMMLLSFAGPTTASADSAFHTQKLADRTVANPTPAIDHAFILNQSYAPEVNLAATNPLSNTTKTTAGPVLNTPATMITTADQAVLDPLASRAPNLDLFRKNTDAKPVNSTLAANALSINTTNSVDMRGRHGANPNPDVSAHSPIRDHGAAINRR